MEQIKIYNKDGNETGEIKASDFLNIERYNDSLIHQVFKSIAANRRKNIAHTKDRSEVSGGGKKPWRQKGTGRARQGSSRSPLWAGGGVSFGPRNTTDYSQKINVKMMKLAIEGALLKKSQSGELKVVDDLAISEPKTKNISKTILNLTGGKSTLLIIPNDDKNILRAVSNLKKVTGIRSKNLNLYDLIVNRFILIDQKALPEIKKQYGK